MNPEDFELNTAISMLRGFELTLDMEFPNYCGDWSILMPLVVEYEITLYKYVSCSGWQAFTGSVSNIEISVNNIDPMLALAKCLLRVLKELVKESNEHRG